jgi:aminoglycoside 3-N-acetyltransferase
MFNSLARGRQKYGLKKYLIREANNTINKLLFKSTRKTLVDAFRAVGVRGQITLCVHASLSRLGYIEGGAATVVDALIEAIGDDGCLAMPAFSMDGTMKHYLDRGETFDVRNTPSHVGAIAEVFRRRDGVLRSVHPSHSLTALGSGAASLLRDHDQSLTPYGYATPYGRMVEDENAYILMINTHIHSLLHHVQERVDFPNLFLDEETEAQCIDYDGQLKTVRTKIMRPRVPYYVAIPPATGPEPDWALLHDFSLMFPTRRDKIVAELGYRFDNHEKLNQRRRQFEQDGILTARKLGRGEIGLLNVARFVRAIQPEFEESIAKYRAYYEMGYIEDKSAKLAFG